MLLANRSPRPIAPADPPAADDPLWERRTRIVLPITLGVAMTLALAGYQYGESNHAVYLVDALRHNDPTLLANDWWAQSTLQYHFVFNRLSAALMRAGLIEPAFLAGYVALAVLLHVGWRRLTLALGGDDTVYLASVVLYHLMAAGTGLGVYHFLQNSAFLPSNISNVAMLWGVLHWVRGRPGWAGFYLGIAGLFHLNHALAGIGLWVGLTALSWLRPGGASSSRGQLGAAAWWVGTCLVIGLSLAAIAPAISAVLSKTDSLPLREFVDLYVRLRHPHHYDPSSWPLALWATFLLPIVLSVPAYRIAMREESTSERFRAVHAFWLFAVMLVTALVGAGIWYVSEPLIQMSLYRFSIYPKLMSCIAAAWLIWRTPRGRVAFRAVVFTALVVFTANILLGSAFDGAPPFLRDNALPLWLFSLFAAVALLRPRVLGWGRAAFGTLTAVCAVVSLGLSWTRIGIAHDGLRGDDVGYMELCQWVRHNTPADAVFLVPPDEQSFRLHARRAIVVNFKNVPQLSGELIEWRERLRAALDEDDLNALPKPFHRTLDAIRDRYAARPAEALTRVARQYGARYVVSVRQLDAPGLGRPLFSNTSGQYFLYDLGDQE